MFPFTCLVVSLITYKSKDITNPTHRITSKIIIICLYPTQRRLAQANIVIGARCMCVCVCVCVRVCVCVCVCEASALGLHEARGDETRGENESGGRRKVFLHEKKKRNEERGGAAIMRGHTHTHTNTLWHSTITTSCCCLSRHKQLGPCELGRSRSGRLVVRRQCETIFFLTRNHKWKEKS